VQHVITAMHGTTIPVMISFTLRHNRREPLHETLKILMDAWRKMTSCRRWTTLKQRGHLMGYVRSLEVTWGQSNGWHPHLHVLFFLTPEACISTFYKDARGWWETCVKDAGGDSVWEHACKLTVCDGSVAEYITKWGHEPKEETRERLNNWGKAKELTRGIVKRGKVGHITPFDMLELYLLNGEVAPAFWAKLIREYTEAIKGQREYEKVKA